MAQHIQIQDIGTTHLQHQQYLRLAQSRLNPHGLMSPTAGPQCRAIVHLDRIRGMDRLTGRLFLPDLGRVGLWSKERMRQQRNGQFKIRRGRRITLEQTIYLLTCQILPIPLFQLIYYLMVLSRVMAITQQTFQAAITFIWQLQKIRSTPAGRVNYDT